MGTNFYLSKEHSEKYVLPRLMVWMATKANSILRNPQEISATENPKNALLRWFDDLAGTCNDFDYFKYHLELTVLMDSSDSRIRKESIEASLKCLKEQNERIKLQDFKDFEQNVDKAIENNKTLTAKDFEPIKSLILENVIFDDRDGAHIGKRSAAGMFCFNCNETMCDGGKEKVHHSGFDFYTICPKCGCKPEYTYSFRFQWSKDFWKELFAEVDELDIYDEYDEHFTKQQFLEEEIGNAAKACPNNFWDYQLFYEDERRFS